jgi:hypothetical protein
MEGSKPEWMVIRDKAHQASNGGTTSTHPAHAPTSLAASAHEQETVAMAQTITSSMPTFDANLSCMAYTNIPEISFMAHHLLMSLLDSGVTSHLIRD